MHNSTKNRTVMKILPKVKRTVFPVKPFYKPYTHTHTNQYLIPRWRAARAGEAHGSQRAGSRGTAPSVGDRGHLCASSPPGKRWQQGWMPWNRNQPPACWWSTRNLGLLSYLPTSHQITPSEIMTFITTSLLLICLVQADNEVMHIWLLMYLTNRWLWE